MYWSTAGEICRRVTKLGIFIKPAHPIFNPKNNQGYEG